MQESSLRGGASMRREYPPESVQEKKGDHVETREAAWRKYGKRMAIAGFILARTTDAIHDLSEKLEHESVDAITEAKIENAKSDAKIAISLLEKGTPFSAPAPHADVTEARESLDGEAGLDIDLRYLDLGSLNSGGAYEFEASEQAVYFHFEKEGIERDGVYLVNKEPVAPVAPLSGGEKAARQFQDKFVEPVLGDQDYVYTLRYIMFDNSPNNNDSLPHLKGQAVKTDLFVISKQDNALDIQADVLANLQLEKENFDSTVQELLHPDTSSDSLQSLSPDLRMKVEASEIMKHQREVLGILQIDTVFPTVETLEKTPKGLVPKKYADTYKEIVGSSSLENDQDGVTLWAPDVAQEIPDSVWIGTLVNVDLDKDSDQVRVELVGATLEMADGKPVPNEELADGILLYEGSARDFPKEEIGKKVTPMIQKALAKHSIAMQDASKEDLMNLDYSDGDPVVTDYSEHGPY